MAVLKVRDPADPTGQTWIDIMGTGTQGPPGGPVPVGGNPGEIIVKQTAADMDVAWEPHPRVAFESMSATAATGATANVLADFIVGTVTIDPDRWYHIFASVRCIQDAGVAALAQFQVKCGVDLQGYDVVSCHDNGGLWGAWSQNWLHKGNLLNGDQPTKSVECKLRGMVSVAAAKTFYNPRLYVVEY